MTPVEKRWLAAVQGGELLDLTEEPDRDVRATVIRDLLCGRQAGALDPRGVRLAGARIVGGLDLTDVRASVPLVLTACELVEPILARRAHLPHVDLTGSTFPTLNGDDLVCEHNLLLARIRCQQLSLENGSITGILDISGATLAATNGPALDADGLTVSGGVVGEGFRASSDSSRGTICLLGASITGQLAISGATLTATNGPALAADGLTVGGNVVLGEGFEASSDSTDGTIRFLGASITGQLAISGATLTATNGPALAADKLTVGANMFLDDLFEASSDSSRGTICLLGASITGQLIIFRATLTATNGPALAADGLTVGEDIRLDDPFEARSNSSDGTIRLCGATITGSLSLGNGFVYNSAPERLLFHVRSAEVQGDLILPVGLFTSPPQRPGRVNVDGLSYAFMPWGASCDEWIRLLGEHMPEYAAQPYQQLAKVHRAAGHDRDVRRILIAQQRDHRQRGDIGNWLRRLLHRASGAVIGYGHRPWGALVFLVGVCAVAGGSSLTARWLGLAVHPGPAGGTCSVAESIGFALDTTVPLIKLGGEKRCMIATTTGWGQVFYLATYAFQALGWAFATLFVAGYTGLVRQTT